MKVRFERETLLAQIKPIDRIIGTNTHNEFARLEARMDSIVWEGCGEESEARRRYPTEGVTVEREGSVDVRARLILEIAERTPKDGWVTIIREGAPGGRQRASGVCADTLVLCDGPQEGWKGARFTVNRLVEARKPFEAGGAVAWATLKGKTLKAMLSACETDAKGNRGNANMQYFREGVRMERVEGTLRCTSTDMVDITWSETGDVRFHTPASPEGEEQWTIRAASANELRDLVPDGEEEVTITLRHSTGEEGPVNALGIASETTDWNTTIIALKYPATGPLIERIRASRATGKAIMSRTELKRAAKICRIAGGDVEISATGEGMLVRSRGGDEGEDVVECPERSGTIPPLAISSKRLEEIGDILNSEQVTLSYVEGRPKVLVAVETEADPAGLGAMTHWIGSVTASRGEHANNEEAESSAAAG